MESDKALGFEFKRVTNAIKRHLSKRLAAAGYDEITITHGWILGHLYRHRNENIYQKNLEMDFQIARSTATCILQQLEKKGYITRTSVESDARLKKIELTGLGIETHLNTVEIIDKMHEDMEVGITDEERKNLYVVINKIKHNIDKAEKELTGGQNRD